LERVREGVEEISETLMKMVDLNTVFFKAELVEEIDEGSWGAQLACQSLPEDLKRLL